MANSLKFNDIIFGVGDEVKVHLKVKEGTKERVQIFQGIVIAIKGTGDGKSIIVRKISGSFGIERIWPVNCPSITKIEVSKNQPAKRAKLYYLRHRIGKKALKVKGTGTKRPEEKKETEKSE